MARYVPAHVPQMDGSKCETTNCWAAVGAWGVDGLTGGDRTPKPTWFRFKAKAQDCRPGGLGDIIRGLANMGLWRSKTARYVVDMTPARLRRRLRTRTGALVCVETDFEVWPEYKNCQPGFDGYHMVGVICGRDDEDRVRVMDPLCKEQGYRWVKVEAIVRAAVQYNNEHAGEARNTVDGIVLFPPKEG